MKNFLISLSFANLIFLPVWNTLLENSWYYNATEISFSPILLPATMLLVLILGICIYGIIVMEDRYSNKYISISLTLFLTIFVVLAFWSLFNTVTVAEWRVYFGFIDRRIKIAALGCFIIYLFIKAYKTPNFQKRLLRVYKNILLIFAPFLLFTIAQATKTFTSIYFYQAEGPVPYLETKENRPRVALLLFDELDIRAAFDQRPPHLQLKNLDLFKNESFYASQAYAGGPATLISIPALLTGQHLSSITPTAHDEALLTLTQDEKKTILNNKTSSLFSRARQIGCNCGIRGFYHPYHRLFGRYLSEGDFKSVYNSSLLEGILYILNKTYVGYLSFFPELKKHLTLIDSTAPQILVIKETKPEMLDQEHEHLNLINYWSSLMTNKRLNLVFLHFPYPHPPGIYDYETDRFCHAGEGSYLGNIKMVDKTLADMRERLKDDSLWDKTTILITSDHWLRKYWPQNGYDFKEDEIAFIHSNDHRVPFMVKFADQKESYVFEEPFSTVLVHDIILEIFKGSIQNAKQLATWIQLHKDKTPLDVAESLDLLHN